MVLRSRGKSGARTPALPGPLPSRQADSGLAPYLRRTQPAHRHHPPRRPPHRLADLWRRPRPRPAARRARPGRLRARRAVPGNGPHPGQRPAANDAIRPRRPPDRTASRRQRAGRPQRPRRLPRPVPPRPPGRHDSRRGRIDYRYDPVGRLLAANSAMGHETFAFDPADNIQAPDAVRQLPTAHRVPLPKLMDNLLKEYAGISYRYDERGNVVERTRNGQRSTYEWDAFNRMTRAVTSSGVTTFAYDPLGRRIAKHSKATDGAAPREPIRTMYGWDGDTLALESSVHGGREASGRTVHYVYERDTFVPLVQATRNRALELPPTTDVKALMAENDGKYAVALDPLWK